MKNLKITVCYLVFIFSVLLLCDCGNNKPAAVNSKPVTTEPIKDKSLQPEETTPSIPNESPIPPISEMPEGIKTIAQPNRKALKELTVNNDFNTYPKVATGYTLETFKTELGITAFRLAATKKVGDDYYIENFNYQLATPDHLPTLIIVAGKNSLEDSFGNTQNGVVNKETRAGIEGLAKRENTKIKGDFAKQLTAFRVKIADYLKNNQLSAMNNKQIAHDIPRGDNFKRVDIFIESFYANTNLKTQEFDRSSLVISQVWKKDKRPYKIDNNLGIMYVVSPNQATAHFKKDANAWLSAIFDSGINIIANAINVLESRALDNIAIQIHLIGGGKFRHSEVSIALTNYVFTWAIKYGIDNLLPFSEPGKFKLREKIILHFAFTPYEDPTRG
jgi:hypothetical protein